LRKRRGQNTVRIIGGAWRRRLLEFPDAGDLRPTPDRVRETLFNWLGQDLTGQACLDLFAGSGVLGFEAASRGAREVVLVESDAAAVRALHASRQLLGATQVDIVRREALEFLQADRRLYDLVFLDPPYRLNLLPRVLPLLGARLAPDASVYLEAGELPALPEGYELYRHEKAGKVKALLIKWRNA
jgi:16S rRNA (guanine(966)-N(2))-methyltransferase RsmD